MAEHEPRQNTRRDSWMQTVLITVALGGGVSYASHHDTSNDIDRTETKHALEELTRAVNAQTTVLAVVNRSLDLLLQQRNK